MKFRYKIISFFLLSLSISMGCKKIPTFHSSNEKDPHNDEFVVTPPDTVYISESYLTDRGYYVHWSNTSDGEYVTGYILKVYNDSLKAFEEVSRFGVQQTGYFFFYHADKYYFPLDLRFGVASYIELSEDSIKQSILKKVKVNQNIEYLNAHFTGDQVALNWQHTLKTKQAKITIEKSVNGGVYQQIAELTTDAIFYNEALSNSISEIFQYRIFAKNKYVSTDTVYSQVLTTALEPPQNVEVVSSTNSELTLLIENPPVVDEFKIELINNTGALFYTLYIEPSDGDSTIFTLDNLILDEDFALHVSSGLFNQYSNPILRKVGKVPHLSYESHFVSDNYIYSPFFIDGGNSIIYLTTEHPRIYSIEDQSTNHLESIYISDIGGIDVDLLNNFIFHIRGGYLNQFDLDGNEIEKFRIANDLFAWDFMVDINIKKAFFNYNSSLEILDLVEDTLSTFYGGEKLIRTSASSTVYLVENHTLYKFNSNSIQTFGLSPFNHIATNDKNEFITLTNNSIQFYNADDFTLLNSAPFSEDILSVGQDEVVVVKDDIVAVLNGYWSERQIDFIHRNGDYLGYINLLSEYYNSENSTPRSSNTTMLYSKESNRFAMIDEFEAHFFQLTDKWGFIY